MGPLIVIVDEPFLRFGGVHLGRASKQSGVQELVANASVERFDPGILRRFARVMK
jgi:hypothetical protein